MKVGNFDKAAEILKTDSLVVIGKDTCSKCIDLKEKLLKVDTEFLYLDFDSVEPDYPGFFKAVVDVKRENNIKNITLPLIVYNHILYSESLN